MTKQEILQKINEAKRYNYEELNLSAKDLSDLPLEIFQLTNLQKLDLSNNKLRKLPPEIAQLTNLQSLNLSDNQLSELPSEIARLENLRVFICNSNRLSKLPAEIAQTEILQELYLGGNKLSELPSEIGQATNLQSLQLNGNQLKKLPPEIVKLTNLRGFYLGNNQLRKLPPEIVKLTNLRVINLSGNQLSELPPEISQLTNLRLLYLNDNQLSKLPSEIAQLTTLRQLHLGGNQLSELPLNIAQLRKLQILDLTRNILSISEEIVEDLNQPQRIIEYYLESLKGIKSINEGKLILIGQGRVGKTSLRDALTSENGTCSNEPVKTEGLEVVEWGLNIENKGDIKLNIWDFGGQEVYHATHQFFFKSGLYILVVDVDERVEWRTNRLEYWLKKIQTLAGKIEKNNEIKTPVIIVGNKMDANKTEGDLFDLEILREKYTKLEITKFIRVACQKGTNIIEVRAEIIKQLEKIGVYDEFPTTYLDAKKRIQETNKNNISKVEFEEIVEEDAEQKLYVLERIGAITTFADSKKQELKNLIVIKPKWITEGIYKILSANYLLDENKGEVGLEEVKAVLDSNEYPQKEAIIEMMKEYDICFSQIKNKKEVLMFPSYFTVIKPAIKEFGDNSVSFKYIFKILLDNIFPQFVVNLDKTIFQDNLYWRTGVRIIKNNKRVLIEVDLEENTISITAEAETTKERIEILNDIRAKFDEIIGNQEKEEKISIPDNPNEFADYRNLYNLRKQGEKEFPIENLGRFSIDYLLHETDLNSCEFQKQNSEEQVILSEKKEKKIENTEKLDRQNKYLLDKVSKIKPLSQGIKLLKEKSELEVMNSKLNGVIEERVSWYEGYIIAFLTAIAIGYLLYYFQNWNWFKEKFGDWEHFFTFLLPVFIMLSPLIWRFLFKKKKLWEKLITLLKQRIEKKIQSKNSQVLKAYSKKCEDLENLNPQLNKAMEILDK